MMRYARTLLLLTWMTLLGGWHTTLLFAQDSPLLLPFTLLSGGDDGTSPLMETSGTYTPTALPCSVNTTCSEASTWSREARATVLIETTGCTGVLLNTARNDGKAYILTAAHCNAPAVGNTVGWTFVFNYDSPSCSNPVDKPSANRMTGAVVRAMNSGDGDYVLLELLQPIPESFNVYYAGWTIRSHSPQSGAVIGHPKRDLKKITFENNPITTYGTTSWMASFDRGTIETGSSGSPLFNESHQLIGLTRGGQLNANLCSGTGGDDNAASIVFPKLSYIWELGNPGQRLRDYIDPASQGGSSATTSLSGAEELLPVELVSFDAKLDGRRVRLAWETASETNNAGFQIEHRTADDDWRALDFVAGYGTTLEARRYDHTVEALEPGTHRFRLKQVDFDGTFDYSPEVEVAVELATAFHLSEPYPNPFNPQTSFSLSVAQTQRVQVAVYNVLGQRVAVLHDGLFESGATRSFRFDAASLPSGLYLIHVAGEQFISSQTITLVR